MVHPISPADARAAKAEAIPDFVVESFNELITENMSLQGTAYVKQDAVISRILTKQTGLSRRLDNKWLDVEPLFEKAGWEVAYDKPGFNESYPATFKFTQKS